MSTETHIEDLVVKSQEILDNLKNPAQIINDLTARLKEALKEVSSLQTHNTQLKVECDTLNGRVNQLESELTEARHAKKQLADNLDSIMKIVERLCGDDIS